MSAEEVRTVQWDLGPEGLALLAVMSLAFGAFAQLVFLGRGVWWVGAVAAAVSFVVGLFVSEVWFGWATAAELQPNIDGLSFDEVLLIGLVPGILAVVATWYATRTRQHAPLPR